MSQFIKTKEPFNSDYLGTTSLSERGWTKSIITKLLPAHDMTRPNPYYKSGSPCKYYLLEKVIAAEATQQFIKLKSKAEKKKSIATVVTATKLSKNLQALQDAIENTNFTENWPKSYKIAVKEAIDSYNERQMDFESDRCAAINDSQEFLNRITCNYIRHQCTDYEDILEEYKGRVGIRKIHEMIQNHINNMFYKTYNKTRSKESILIQRMKSDKYTRAP